jgi:ABC-type bacteriocin/lantibiotic exporter with double-glycine peptidase domain
MGRIQSPISNALSLVSQAYGVIASTERLQELIGLPDEAKGTKLSSFDCINLENVSFRYADSSDDVLLNIDASIHRGDFVALTGISGGGKTSLFQLLLAIYKPVSGRVVFVNGEQEVPACRETRSLFAYVPQGNTLFSGTLRDNLIRFRPDASEHEISKTISAACLDDLIAEVGMEARLGERGIGLSEGQAQRLSVARALMRRAPILLLDEATSALDEATELRMLDNLMKSDAVRTCVIITHRSATAAICSRRYVLTGSTLEEVTA